MREANEIDVVVTVYTSISDDIEKAYRDVEIPAKMQLIQERSVLREFFGIKFQKNCHFSIWTHQRRKLLGKSKITFILFQEKSWKTLSFMELLTIV